MHAVIKFPSLASFVCENEAASSVKNKKPELWKVIKYGKDCRKVDNLPKQMLSLSSAIPNPSIAFGSVFSLSVATSGIYG